MDYPVRPGWKRIPTETIVVSGDVPEEALKTVTVTAEKLDEMLEQNLGGIPRRQIYNILVFETRVAFCKYAARCGAGNALSLYNPNTKEVAVHLGEGVSQEEFLETFAHEMTHAFMDLVYRVTGPLWFAEGMAIYWSKVKWARGGFQPSGKNMDAAIHLTPEGRIPLTNILTATRDDMYGVDFPLYYANCWALVHFLLHRHPEMIELLLAEEIPELMPLEKEYKSYLRKLMGE